MVLLKKSSQLLYGLLAALMLMACGKEKAYKLQLALFPDFGVPKIQAKDLAQLMAQPKAELVILDIRSAPEFGVSHLAGARLLDYEKFSLTDMDGIPQEAQVVVYCSVGYRSGKVGRQLRESGYPYVYNLDGGIMEWKNRGYPVLNPQGNLTDSVHTYNQHWSKYLQKGVAVY